MQDETGARRNFLNRRDWSSFASGLPATTTYPKLEALKTGPAWCSARASRASWPAARAEWLAVERVREAAL
jgi:hypothetical protein